MKGVLDDRSFFVISIPSPTLEYSRGNSFPFMSNGPKSMTDGTGMYFVRSFGTTDTSQRIIPTDESAGLPSPLPNISDANAHVLSSAVIPPDRPVRGTSHDVPLKYPPIHVLR